MEVVLLTVMVALFGLLLTVMLHLHRSTERRFDAVDAALTRFNTASGTHGERIARLEGRAESHQETPA